MHYNVVQGVRGLQFYFFHKFFELYIKHIKSGKSFLKEFI